MDYAGCGRYEWTDQEEKDWQAFIDDPETALNEAGILKQGTKERYDLWLDWFLELKYTPKQERMSWKECLINVYGDSFERYVTQNTDWTKAIHDAAGRMGE
jgi:hypothetical protein